MTPDSSGLTGSHRCSLFSVCRHGFTRSDSQCGRNSADFTWVCQDWGTLSHLIYCCSPSTLFHTRRTTKGFRFFQIRLDLITLQLDSIGSKLIVFCKPQIEGTQKLLNNDMAELISKMRLTQQNAITSLKEECKKQLLAAAHTLAVDSKNMLDAVDQARVRANLAKPVAP